MTRPADFSEAAWAEVLTAVDRIYADLVDYQERQSESKPEKRRQMLREGLGFETILHTPTSPMNAVIAAGVHPYDFIARDYGMPLAVAGSNPPICCNWC